MNENKELLAIANSCDWMLHGDRTREQFAESIGVCARTLRRWEKAVFDPYQQFDYYPPDRKHKRKNLLDRFQMVLLLWVNSRKQKGKTTEDVFREFLDYAEVTRQQLDQYIKEQTNETSGCL